MNHSWTSTFWHCSKSRKIWQYTWEQKVTLWGCAGLSPLLPTPAVVLRECTGGLPFKWVAYLMRNWGDLIVIGFGLKEGTCTPSWVSCRTGKSSIILGFSKILKLALIDYLLRAIAIDWLNAVNIWLWMLANHHKLLIFISVLDFIATLQVVA